MKLLSIGLTALLLASCSYVPEPTVERQLTTARPDGSIQTQVVVEPNPEYEKAAKTIGEAAEKVKPDWAPMVQGVLGVGLAGLGAYAKVREARANKQLRSVVQGVETGGDAKTKAAVRDASRAAGVEEALHRTVKEVTK